MFATFGCGCTANLDPRTFTFCLRQKPIFEDIYSLHGTIAEKVCIGNEFIHPMTPEYLFSMIEFNNH